MKAIRDYRVLLCCFLFFCGKALACECSSTLDEKSADRVFVGSLSSQYQLEFSSMVDEEGEKLEGEEGKKIYGSFRSMNYFKVFKIQKGPKEEEIVLETGATDGCGVRLQPGKSYKIYTQNYLAFASGQAKTCAFRAKLLPHIKLPIKTCEFTEPSLC